MELVTFYSSLLLFNSFQLKMKNNNLSALKYNFLFNFIMIEKRNVG